MIAWVNNVRKVRIGLNLDDKQTRDSDKEGIGS